MALTWGQFRLQIRNGILQDSVLAEGATEFRYTDESLRVACGWALDEFAQHTAVATSTSYSPATSLSYGLPDNLYDPEPLEQTGFVYLSNGVDKPVYLDPINYTPVLEVYDDKGFMTYPDHTLLLSNAGTDLDTLYVRYFAYYNHPYQDSDIIAVPQWALPALSYLVGGHAISGYALKSASIRQWGAKPDTGTPEQNPLRLQQREFFKIAHDSMDRFPRQDRTQWFRRNINYSPQE